MNLAEFSVKRPVAVTMRIASFVLLGAVVVAKLPVDLLPKVSVPTVAVRTDWPNVAPEEIESQITRVVERAVSSAPNVYQVSSTSTTGESSVRIQFNWGTDIGQAAVDVLQLVQRAKSQFPNDSSIDEPVVSKYDPSATPIRIYGVSGMSDDVKLRSVLDNEVSPLVEAADGVAAANVIGGQKRAIVVDVDTHRMEAYHLTLSQVASRLMQENQNTPGGIAKLGDTELTIRSTGFFGKPEEALQVPVASVKGQLVKLADIATVRDLHQETRMFTRLNGEPAVGLVIVKQSDANTVSTAEAVEKKIDQVKRSYPQLNFNVAYDQSGFIKNSIDDLKSTALIGGLLAVGILLLFLRNLRSTLVVALSIPISIVSSFALLYFCGYTLNTISLSGLALATGLIVDDAVVVIENIFRHIERDKLSPWEASISGANEIMSAVVASTMTIMVVFLPLLLLKGQSGQTFTQFSWVVMFSIAISLLDATTVVPMLASRLVKAEEVEEEAHPELRALHGKKTSPLTRFFDWFGERFSELDASYRSGLGWALKHRYMVVGGACTAIVASFLLMPMVGSEMMPQTDSGDFTVNVKLPIGTAVDKTNATMKDVEATLMQMPDVQTVFSAAGTFLSNRGGTSEPISYQGSATVKLKPNRKHSTQEVIRMVQRKLSSVPGTRITATPYDLVTNLLSGGSANMEVDLVGSNLGDLRSSAQQVMDGMRGIPGLESVDIGVQDTSPELQWKIDRQKALQLGVTFQDVADLLNDSTNGKLSSYYQEGGFQYPIYVQVPENQRKTVTELLDLPVPSKLTDANGQPIMVRLGQVATPIQGFGPSEITRIDRQRYLAVNGRVQGRPESDVQSDIQKVMDKTTLPQGVRWQFGTNQRRRAEEFSGLGATVFLAIALIYMLLASQFESFVYPLVVLTSVPLCSIGVILALFLTGRAFGLTAFIGLLMLVGIVVKNGILLVDYTNQLRSRGRPRKEAILTAGPTRLRPILMTSSAAILGMLPLAMAIGKGSEMQAPLATAVIGGLLTSTILTLFVVPVVYTLFDDLSLRLRHKRLDEDLALEPVASAAEPSVVGPRSKDGLL